MSLYHVPYHIKQPNSLTASLILCISLTGQQVGSSRYFFNYRHSSDVLGLAADWVNAGIPAEHVHVWQGDDTGTASRSARVGVTSMHAQPSTDADNGYVCYRCWRGKHQRAQA